MRLEIVTPLGVELLIEDLDQVIVRRLETAFERGSEVAFLPGHAPELVHTGAGVVRWTHSDGHSGSAHVGSGFAECAGDTVALLTPVPLERARSGGPDAG